MCAKDTLQRFGIVSQLFHWVLAILIVIQLVVILFYEEVPKESPLKLELILLHKSMGITILVLGLGFIIWRLINQRPLLPENMSPLSRFLAKAIHFFLFAFLVVLPFTGYTLSTLAGRATSWFGMFQLPMIFSANDNLTHLFKEIHEYLGFTLIGLVILHALAALYHHFIVKDNVLRRMWPGAEKK